MNAKIEIEPGLKRMILIEIIFPMVLLILGIYHGLDAGALPRGHDSSFANFSGSIISRV